MLHDVSSLPSGRKIHGDRPSGTLPGRTLNQPQRLVLTDELRVPERVDQHLRVHRPRERPRPGEYGLPSR